MSLEAATYVNDLVSTNPVGSDVKSQGDDHIRLLKTVLKATLPGLTHAVYLDTASADVASATTTDIGAVTSNFVRITGTTTITSLGTATAGILRLVYFAGALTLTHNATSLILPGAANITTAAGAAMIAISLGSGNWRVPIYQPASGKAIIAPAFSEITGKPTTLSGYGITDAAAISQTDESFYGVILNSLSDRDYRIVLKAAHGGTVTETTTRCVSGTATATFKVNTSALGGTANSVSSSEQSQAHASANTFAAGDDIVITISASAACVDMSFSIKYTRTYA